MGKIFVKSGKMSKHQRTEKDVANLSHEATNAKGDKPSLPSGGNAPTAPTLLVMLALTTAVFLAALDTVAITVALPSIAEDLRASDTAYSWIASVYLLA